MKTSIIILISLITPLKSFIQHEIPKNNITHIPPDKVVVQAILTAYTNSVDETDDDPNIMASGKEVYDGAIACPSILKFGDVIKIHGFEYVCEDRMNKRYRDSWHFDMFVHDKDVAFELGRRIVEIEILSTATINKDQIQWYNQNTEVTINKLINKKNDL